MSFGYKKDRTARLLRVEHLLYQNPRGLGPDEIARLCDVSVRTTYRDLRALQGALEAPVWQDEDGRYGIERSHFLPPIKLSLQEAMALFISARLFSKYSDERDPNVESAFIKLASVLPPPVSQHVQETVSAMAQRRRDENFARVFDILTTVYFARL